MRHSIVNRRREYKARLAHRSSVASHKRPVAGGVQRFRLNKMQKYLTVRPRKAGEAAPQGEFPKAMVAPVKGHGQEPQALLRKGNKKEKEYF